MPADARRATLFTQPLEDIATGTTTGSYTVGTGKCAVRIDWCAAGSDGSLAITLAGGSTRTITIPGNSGWHHLAFERGAVPAATTIVFTGVASNFVCYGRAA